LKKKQRKNLERPLTNEEEQLISKIADEHCGKTFGYFDRDDIWSEIWIICLNAIGEFNSDKGPLENFLRVTVKNRLTNEFKRVTKTIKSPCPKCPYYDPGKSPSDCKKFGDDRHLCDKWVFYQATVQRRNGLMTNAEDKDNRETPRSLVSEIENKEIIEMIKAAMDSDMLGDFINAAAGNTLPANRMKRMKLFIEEFLDKNNLNIN
jgi:hypothetical protein